MPVVVLALRDLVPAPGWSYSTPGGRPEGTPVRASSCPAPVALTITDEGLDGLALHLLNDPGGRSLGSSWSRSLIATEIDRSLKRTTSNCPGDRRPHWPSTGSSFRDISYAYRFGEQIYDVVRAELRYGEQTVGVTYVLDAPWRMAQL